MPRKSELLGARVIVCMTSPSHGQCRYRGHQCPWSQERRLRSRCGPTPVTPGPAGETLDVIAGFLGPHDWIASYIRLPNPEGPAQPFLTAMQFQLGRLPTRAVLVAAAQGVYQGWVNGVEVDDSVLKPGWTAYSERIVHEWTDVIALLTLGDNVLAFEVAGGWFTERYGFSIHGRRFYGEQPSVAGQIIMDFEDGSRRIVATDHTWRATGGGVTRSSGIYQGEEGDGRRAVLGWARVPLASAQWGSAELTPGPTPQVAIAEPVRRMTELPVREVTRTKSGHLLIDFGQNLVGRLRITVEGPAGTVITLRHAEVLENGELGTRPLREAWAKDTYTLSGDGREV